MIDMKLLSKELLLEYGFSENSEKTNKRIVVMTKDNFDIILKDEEYYYSNFGIDYPLKDLSSLRKLYKEVKNQELKPV